MTRTTFTSLALLSSLLLVSADDVKMCQQFQGLTSSSGRYTMGTNQWGADGSGGQCVFFNPAAEPENDATAFRATWSWSAGIDNVHAYPNIYYNSAQLPVQVNNTKGFEVDIDWTYGTGNAPASSTELSGLTAMDMKANVAFDFFLDMDWKKSSNATIAAYEFMVWLASFNGAQPLGYETTADPIKYTLSGQEFTLYAGDNKGGQHVYSWYPTNGYVSNFKGDLNVLLQYTASMGLLPENIYLGSVQFGSECTHAPTNVTFNAKNVMMDMKVIKARSAAVSRSAASMTLLLSSLGFTLYWFGLL